MADGNPSSTQVNRSRHVELLIHQLDALPTLGAVMTRLAGMIVRDDADNPRLLDVLQHDPAMTCTLLAACRYGGGRHGRISTAADAVRHLGPDLVEALVLSAPVLELWDLQPGPGGEQLPESSEFCRAALWQHSVAVGWLSRTLAESCTGPVVIDPHEAFTAGLLHDLGIYVLHVLLPESMEKICHSVGGSRVPMAQACEQVIGMTPSMAGRRLAEHWRLPHMLGDVIWLHGQPAASLPNLRHRPLIELITLADAAARARYVVPSGHLPGGEDLAELARPLGLTMSCVEDALAEVPSAVSNLASRLGISERTDQHQMTMTLTEVNSVLGRRVARNARAAEEAEQRAEALTAITRFHDTEASGGSFPSMLGRVVTSAREVFGGRYFAIIWQARASDPWQFMRFAGDGRLLRSELIEGPPGSNAVPDLADEVQLSVDAMAMLPWLSVQVHDAPNRTGLKLLPLRCGWGVQAILVHDANLDGRCDRMRVKALTRTWAGVLVTASHHAGAKALGEHLAHSNRKLIEARDELTRREKLASLGEIAAGAAHEMNNPLTVISGRAQLLSSQIENPQHREMAKQIFEQSHRLSDMISSLRSFAEPVVPVSEPVALDALLQGEIEQLQGSLDKGVTVRLAMDSSLPPVLTDPHNTARAVRELLRNAAESEGSRDIELRVQIDPLDDRLQIQIVDDGIGLTCHALAHAFDPFFSAKTAGRQPGLGLATARRLMEAQGGQITLENGPDRGAVATIWIAAWRDGKAEVRNVA